MLTSAMADPFGVMPPYWNPEFERTTGQSSLAPPAQPPGWLERASNFMQRYSPPNLAWGMLPPPARKALEPWAGMLNPMEWTPYATMRDTLDASGNLSRSVMQGDPWGTLAAGGSMLLAGLPGPGNKLNPPVQNSSRSAMLFDPPSRPQRPFEADYPEMPTDAIGQRLTHDIEGRPLTAERVVGRSVVGGKDVALPPAELDALATRITGRPSEVVAPREIQPDVGRYHERWDPLTGDRIRDIALSRALTAKQAPRVLGHEIGHAIDEAAGRIPTEGIVQDLRRVYNTLNTGQTRTRNLTGPEHRGYKGDDIPREMMAEAIRAYVADPNYLKTVAPRVAARIREYVNSHPQLSRAVQFNSMLLPVIALGAPNDEGGS